MKDYHFTGGVAKPIVQKLNQSGDNFGLSGANHFQHGIEISLTKQR